MSFGANLLEIVHENANHLLSSHKSWERIRLGEVAKIINGYPFDSRLFQKDTGYPLLRIRDIFNSKTDIRYVGEIPEGYWVLLGDIVVGMDGDFNCARWKGEPALLNQRVCKLEVDVNSIDQRFLFYSLGGYLKAINENTSSITVKHLSSRTIADIPLPYPPLDEQTRIADKLDTLLARVDSCQTHLARVPQLLKRFRQSVLAAATSGRLTEGWREERNEAIDETWQSVLFGDLIADGPKNGLYKPASAYGDGTRILRIDMFYAGEVLPWEGMKRLSVTIQEMADYALAINDIVINRVNSLSHLGKSALIRSLPEPCVFESNMMRIRVDQSRILPEYCIRFLSSQQGLAELRQNAKHAVNQASINQTDIKSVNIPLPPLPEQHEIVRRVEALFAMADRLEARWRAAQGRVGSLTPSLLAKAFRGELVPQDAGDESAAGLLR